MRNTCNLVFAAIAALVIAASALGQNAPKPPNSKSRKPAAKPAASAPAPVRVNDLAAKPEAHVGKVTLVGVVATVKEKKGFVLIDTQEYKECGLSCLTEAGTKKVPVRWSGAAPKVKDAVKVDGMMEKTGKGFAFTAQKVAKG